MIEFNKFKQAACNFYRQNTHLHYWIYVDAHWQKSSVVVEFKIDNVKVAYSYELRTEYTNVERRNKKAERLMKEIGKDLQGIKNEC